eukprot:gene4413-14540_t
MYPMVNLAASLQHVDHCVHNLAKMVQGSFKFHQYQVVGRHMPTETEPSPTVYRMKVWAEDSLRRVKKANGQILAVNEIFEKKPTTVKNFGIWVRYQSRTGYHNMYKEYRDVTLNGAVNQLYQEMASRHRVRYPCIQIIKTATVPASACKRENTKQFHDAKIKFPLTHKLIRPSSRVFRTTFKANRPTTAMF